MKTKTVARTTEQLQVGDRVKFGKDDFRRIAGFTVKTDWPSQPTWINFDPATVPAGAYADCDSRTRGVWRVAA